MKELLIKKNYEYIIIYNYLQCIYVVFLLGSL